MLRDEGRVLDEMAERLVADPLETVLVVESKIARVNDSYSIVLSSERVEGAKVACEGQAR